MISLDSMMISSGCVGLTPEITECIATSMTVDDHQTTIKCCNNDRCNNGMSQKGNLKAIFSFYFIVVRAITIILNFFSKKYPRTIIGGSEENIWNFVFMFACCNMDRYNNVMNQRGYCLPFEHLKFEYICLFWEINVHRAKYLRNIRNYQQ